MDGLLKPELQALLDILNQTTFKGTDVEMIAQIKGKLQAAIQHPEK